MRLFAASAFSPAFVGNLKAIADYARDNAGRDAVKWVPPENFHLTYVFLGELERPEPAIKGLEAGLAGIKRISAVSGGLGVFPSPRRPNALWVGISEGAAELRELARRLAEGLAGEGLSFEDRFEPHVTIGRVKKPLPENFFRRTGDYAAGRRARTEIVSVDLMESRLTPEGPVYRQVYSKSLL
ncbi:MAG: RNA 2',3'-cyclic phosphodiesterase [Elusimicrobiales bacterium]|nr:RNA 2',3'-cyclic phosphodiesterase [Elusimicrobiales bacterium]